MPYIKQEDRPLISKEITALCKALEQFDEDKIDGALNYTITVISARTLNRFNTIKGDWRYKWMSNVVKAFECAKLEFYRRVGAKQEEKAISKNGDIEEYKE